MKRFLLIVITFIIFIIAGYLLSFPCQVKLDIKPKSCPNPLNIKSKGVLPVAILGGTVVDGFFLNVDSINVCTVRLEGVAPIRWSIEDVGAPSEDSQDGCGCTTEGPDGIPDLVLKFDKQEIVEAIGPVCDGDTVMLSLSEGSSLLDGSWIHGGDCVIIKAKAKAKASDANALGKAVSSGVPDKFYLDQNYPNPFNPETKISYRLPEGIQVRLTIYNLIGQEVQTIVNNFQPAGYYQVIWKGMDNQGRLASSGIYIYQLTAGTFTQTKKMVLLR